MHMNNIHLIDETFDEHFTDTYHLSLSFDLKGITYCMLDTRVNKCVLLKHVVIGDYAENIALEKLEEIIIKDELLSKKFKSAAFICRGTANALIPDEIFKPEEIKNLFEFQNTLNELDELHFTKIKSAASVLIFSLPSRIADIVKRKIPNISFYHDNYIMIHNACSVPSSEDMRISFNGSSFTILINKQNTITFYNSFNYHAPADVLFYLTGVAGSMNLKPAEIKVLVMGEYEKDSEMQNLLKQYFTSIRFMKPSTDIEYSYKFNEVDAHIFANLFNSLTCVS